LVRDAQVTAPVLRVVDGGVVHFHTLQPDAAAYAGEPATADPAANIAVNRIPSRGRRIILFALEERPIRNLSIFEVA
jgi:hypothetical protein